MGGCDECSVGLTSDREVVSALPETWLGYCEHCQLSMGLSPTYELAVLVH